MEISQVFDELDALVQYAAVPIAAPPLSVLLQQNFSCGFDTTERSVPMTNPAKDSGDDTIASKRQCRRFRRKGWCPYANCKFFPCCAQTDGQCNSIPTIEKCDELSNCECPENPMRGDCSTQLEQTKIACFDISGGDTDKDDTDGREEANDADIGMVVEENIVLEQVAHKFAAFAFRALQQKRQVTAMRRHMRLQMEQMTSFCEGIV